jgi:two-component system alkaline phosphatase synthesis response regulator PhoP
MKPRVLVVDDDVEFTQLIEFNLAQEGCESFAAHTGVHALRMAKAQLPDVILLDVMLPDLNGLAVCEILNSQAKTSDIPILILSSLNQSWAKTTRSKARFVRFFTKPVNLKFLCQTVQAAAWDHLVKSRSHLAEKGL